MTITVSVAGRLAVALGLLPAVLACHAPEPRGPLSDGGAFQQAVDHYLAPYVESGNFSGAVLVVRDGHTVLERGYGWADARRRVPNTPETRFQIASLSKSFTAAAILRLRDRGALELDDPLARFVRDFPRASDITLHQLLVHMSGIGRYVFEPDYGERSRRAHTAADLVAWAAELPVVGAPGARVAYSNANYAILARVIEIASGLDYDEFLQREILGPLDLIATGHATAGPPPVAGLALGHVLAGAADLAPSRPYDYTVMTGAGSLFSTVGDLHRWFRALRSGAVLASESTRLAFTDHVDGRGYGWMLETRHDRPVIAMSGWDGVGFSTRFVHVSDERLTVIVLCNLNVSALPEEVARNIVAIVLGEEPEPLDLEPGGWPTRVREIAGTYRFGPDFYVPNATMELSASEGQLIVLNEGAPVGALLATSDGGFIHRQQWFRVTFDRETDGAVTAMRYGGFEATRDTGGVAVR